MGASHNKPKRCETCACYKPGDLKGQGWCMHPKRQQSGGILLLVRARALDCRNSWGEDYWTPKDADASVQPPDTPNASPASDVAPVHAAHDDLVIQQASSTRNDGAAMTNISKNTRDDDESINQAALSDQEDRAHVMARGAREAILRARERKKERLSSTRQSRVTAMPATEMDAGNWSYADDVDDTVIRAITDDTVLGLRHQPAVDPFRRSYDDPAPPVPSGELSAETRSIVSSARDERFDSVPEVRDDIELPRPAHLRDETFRGIAGHAVDDDTTELPENPALSSYDRVLQRARRFQRLTTTGGPRRVIRPNGGSPSATTVIEPPRGDADEPSANQEAAADHRAIESQMREAWAEELPSEVGQAEDEEAFETLDDLPPLDHAPDWQQGWEDEIDPFPEDDDAPWLAAESMTLGARPHARSRFRMPQLTFWRHSQSERHHHVVDGSPASEYDEIVTFSDWTESEPEMPLPEPEVDPDWADDAIPVETYAAAQDVLLPADVAASPRDTIVWDESWSDDDWAIEDEAPEPAPVEEDFVTAEATVPHRPQPAPATFDMANLRARLFARQRQTNPSWRADLSPEPSRAGNDDIHAFEPDDDPDPDPGPGVSFDRPAQRHLDDRWAETRTETGFDLREVIRRQGELLDMRIQVAPDVPRECRTCRNFRPAESGERGWCTNEWAFSHRRMVNADDLPCESSIGCWWLPADDLCLPENDLVALTQPTPLVDRMLGRLRQPRNDDQELPLRARAR